MVSFIWLEGFPSPSEIFLEPAGTLEGTIYVKYHTQAGNSQYCATLAIRDGTIYALCFPISILKIIFIRAFHLYTSNAYILMTYITAALMGIIMH